MVRRAFPERGFYFIRPMIKTHDGRAAIDHEAEDIFLHVSQLKASGLKAAWYSSTRTSARAPARSKPSMCGRRSEQDEAQAAKAEGTKEADSC